MNEFMDYANFSRDDGIPYERYLIAGGPGTGKSTLARNLADTLDYPLLDLDGYHWNPGWEMTPLEEFRRRIDQAMAQPTWVADGFYSKIQELLWRRTEAVIWMDRSFSVVIPRLVWRSLIQGITRRELWPGCRASLRQSFFSRRSVIWWAIRSWEERKKGYRELFESEESQHLDIFRVTSPDLSEVTRFSPPAS